MADATFGGDVLVLAGVAFTDYSTPDTLPIGGKQAMAVHKLPGGTRVIDTLGPDENQISWSGTLFDNNAYDMALQLDGLRAAGAEVNLQFAGQSRQVVIEQFTYTIRRLPIWLEYSVTCTVASNPMLGVLGNFSAAIDNLVSTDLSSANTVAATAGP